MAQQGQPIVATINEPFKRWRLIYIDLLCPRVNKPPPRIYKCLAAIFDPIANTVTRNNCRTIFLNPQNVIDYDSNVFKTFQVIIPSLFFFGFHTREDGIIIGNLDHRDESIDSMETFIRKQIGCHVFIDRFGKLFSLRSYIDENDIYRCSTVHNINAIYPVIRYVREFDVNTNAWIRFLQEPVFGLYFRKTKKYLEGDRWYHRSGIEMLSAGGVYEWNEPSIKQLLDYLKKGQNPQFRYYGIFVCAGAKLVVVDECLEPNKMRTMKREHNRSFIQQGGLLLVGSQFVCHEMKAHFVDNNIKVCKEYDWNEFVGRLETVERKRLNPITVKHLMGYRNPIIFIGPNDSNFNSIAWELNYAFLSVIQKELTPEPELIIPEGAHIVAIADGAAGVQEICDRMGYEMLHDSVLTEHATTFRPPSDKVSLEMILNVNEIRSFSYRLHIDTPVQRYYVSRGRYNQFPSFHEKPLFREFNFMKLQLADLDFYWKRTTRLPVPPMYPPFCSTRHEFQFIPNHDMPNEVESCYPSKNRDAYQQIYSFKRLEGIGKPWKNIECVLLKGHQYVDYDWIRVKDPLLQHIVSVDSSQRIGIDGWVWQKVPKNQNSQFMTSLYCPVIDETNLAQSLHKVGETGRAHGIGGAVSIQ